ncbi:Arm DNA-binding domain-containing protein [Gaoshiqia sp. Z1-71]|uniref:Arm DNA-binding domain-containing protein n=1 Tax=Gaoshiqia hydrogeniformans TaxID=3290090 RepID=UPI003BF85386
MRITINLSLKNSKSGSTGKTPVYARITLEGRRAEISTGIFVDPEQWDNHRQLISGKGEPVTILNNRLSKFVSKVNDFYNQLVAIGEDFDITDLKERITGPKNQKQVRDMFDLTIQSVEGKLGHGYTYSTLKHYRTCRKRLDEFIRKQYGRTDMALSRVN